VHVFDVTMSEEPARVVVSPRGELDLATAPLLAEILDKAATPGSSVTLDLGELEFIDSTGLDLIWETFVRSRRDGFVMTLSPAPAMIMKAFDVVDLTDRLPFSSTPG
jgi:anti-anti-sigma factor